MQLPDEFTSFWGIIIEPGKIAKVLVPDGTDCILTNVCFGQEQQMDKDAKTSLFVRIKGQEPAHLINLKVGYFESTQMNLTFGENDELEFYTEGAPYSVHISGFLNGGLALSTEIIDKTQ